MLHLSWFSSKNVALVTTNQIIRCLSFTCVEIVIKAVFVQTDGVNGLIQAKLEADLAVLICKFYQETLIEDREA